jgi:alkyl sulfatase BDS1-like metallo-beta-lactamase superfamily hydrolase
MPPSDGDRPDDEQPASGVTAAPDQDVLDADRGLIGRLEPGVVTAADGRVVWDQSAYAFLDGPCPPTAHPGLWRQSRLCARQGLYEVAPGLYQVRGLDLSNMTLIEGAEGVIVIDPLISTECAAAALALYRRHRGDRPVTGLLYTHPHIDHFGGAAGVVDGAGAVPVVAPEGFAAHAVSENVVVGTAMARRAVYLYGSALPVAPAAQIGTGLGLATSRGTISLVPPTVDVTHTGQELVLDGVRMEFQLTPGTEAPVEMNLAFPDLGALCLAENATHHLHNIGTLRGALVRDARAWARYLAETIERYGARVDVAFASHHWPTWGQARVVRFLAEQRDLYGFLHDQTVRRMNQGETAAEIAEDLTLPPVLAEAWHTRGYYGSISHNVKAIYQRYLGWYDGNPANLWPHPPVARAQRYVACLGGAEATVATARRYAAAGDLRFAAELLNHVVFAEPDRADARAALADVYTRLGHGAENGTWRNMYLTGAAELGDGAPRRGAGSGGGLVGALSVEQLFDAWAVRIDGRRAAAVPLAIDWTITDTGERWRTSLSNGVFLPRRRAEGAGTTGDGPADCSLTLARGQVLGALLGDRAGVDVVGDASALDRLAALLDQFDPAFPIVTP